MADEIQNAPAQATPPPTFGDVTPTEQKPAAPPTSDVATPTEANPAPNAQPDDKATPSDPNAPKSEAPAQERIVPETYDLKLPEDTFLDKRSLERLQSYAKTNKLTQEEAANLVKNQDEDVKAAMKERSDMWLEETKNDREIGGQNLERNVDTAKRFLDKHMAPELRQELTRTGYGNNRLFMKFVLDLAARSANDQVIMPGTSSPSPIATEDLLYGATTSRRK
jgi:hypothetical protein